MIKSFRVIGFFRLKSLIFNKKQKPLKLKSLLVFSLYFIKITTYFKFLQTDKRTWHDSCYI